MPCLNLSTNVNLEGVDTSSILSEATSTVATLIGKPESYVMIVLKGSVPISFGGTEQEAAYGELVSIGGLNPDVNKKLSAAIAAILETKLSVPKTRFFLKFYDTKARFQLWMEWNYFLNFMSSLIMVPLNCGWSSLHFGFASAFILYLMSKYKYLRFLVA
ncbi:macrophage migration inhibition factor-like protein [Medicago truncatula]|uniref:Macrophage migration inhibition factor-like protein n=1 Tax=Medicago truncatula TaxID=3880 RepID=A0A072USK6_MEDTR|nr:macrophage migration inhibition factor-like protein [Medicago truncatula]